MDELRERLLDLANDAPAAGAVPPRLIRRTHRRIGRNVAAISVALALVAAGSLSAFRAIGRAEPGPATRTPVVTNVTQRWFEAARGRIVVEGEGTLVAVDPTGVADPVTLHGGGIPQNWSADGSRLLVAAGDRGLDIISGGGIRTVVEQVGGAGWGSLSPDGSTVVYEAGLGLKVVNADGGASRVLLSGGRGQPRPLAPSWSPDGRHIAYIAAGPGARTWSLSLINADGTGREVLVDLSGHRYTEAGWISWSPDGSRLAFALNQCKLCARIYTVAADGSGLRKITRQDSVSPVWSPDGSRIAFIARGEVATMNSDGTDIVSLGIPAPPPFMTWNPAP